MRNITISDSDAGQRFDKYLKKYLSKAQSGFIYKMLRKKNIVLNQKKASGSEKLASGDVITLYLADDTIDKFSVNGTTTPKRRPCLPLRWGCICRRMRPSTCLKAQAMPSPMAPSGIGSCGTVWNTKSITSIRSIRYCLNTIRNSWVRDLSPAR